MKIQNLFAVSTLQAAAMQTTRYIVNVFAQAINAITREKQIKGWKRGKKKH
jgi:predicted GIY-YIG superfamily endonuclease